MPGFNDLNLMTRYGISMPLPKVDDPVELQSINRPKPDNEIDTSSVHQEQAPRPADVNQQLARLLTNVSRNAFAEVSVGELDVLRPTLAKKSSRLTREQLQTNAVIDSLRDTVRQAHDALAKIYNISAKRLVAAYAENTNSVQDLNIQDIFDKAISSQFDLAAELANRRDVPDAVRERLDDLSLRASSRAAELCTLRSELVLLAETAKTADAEKHPTVKLVLSKKLGELMQTMSGSMHGQIEIVSRFENELKDFTNRADALEAKTGKISDGEIAALADAGAALATELEKCRSSFPDDKLHAQLVLTLRSVRTRVNNLLQTVVDTARRDIRNILPRNPLGHFFGPDPLLPDFEKKIPTLAKFNQTHRKFTEALENFLANPSQGNASKMKSAAKTLKAQADRLPTKMDVLVEEASAAFGDSTRLGGDTRLTEDDRTFMEVISSFARGRAVAEQSEALDDFLKLYGVNIAFVDLVSTLATHTGTLKTNLSRDDLSGDDILRALRGETTISAVLESRINGATSESFDPLLDDRNLVSSSKLGEGAANSVLKLTYRMPDNSTKSYAFKPEIPGQVGLCHLKLGNNAQITGGDAYRKTQHVLDLNVSTRETAKLLGCDALIGDVKATVHNGVFGLLMEMSPGIPSAGFNRGEKTGKASMKLDDLQLLKSLDPARYMKIRGEIVRQTTDLAWLDMLTGQGDRHANNYLVNINRETGKVTVTGIDNDMCFADYRLGLGQIHLSPSRKQRLLAELHAKMGGSLQAAKELLNRHVKNDIVNINDPKLPLNIRFAAKLAFGLRAGVAPQVMSRSMYEKLHNLTEGDIRRWKDDLARRLDDHRAEQAVRRLNEMRVLAEKYLAEGRVIDEDKWSTADTEQKLVAPGEKDSKSNMEIHLFNRDFKKTLPFVDPNAPGNRSHLNDDDGYSGDGED